MKRSYRYTLGVLTFLILLTITVGTSYAYYTVAPAQITEEEIIATCFDFKMLSQETSSIDLKEATPINEEEALKLEPITFKVTNICDRALNYAINLNTSETSESSMNELMMYKLITPTNDNASTKLINSRQDPKRASLKGALNSFSLNNGKLRAGESKEFKLYLWINEEASSYVSGKTFVSFIDAYGYL